VAAKCPHCGGEATLEAIRAANGRCPNCGSAVKVKFTGAPRPVSRAPGRPPAEGLRHSLESIGPYEILAEISRGGMGIVYKALDKSLKKTVAIKVLLRGAESSSDELKRFRREAEAAAKLQHSNIVPIHAVGVCQGLHYFVMDFIEGEPLSELVERGGVSPRQALDYIEQLADALAYAHAAGVIHRDIKPANVMIDRFGRPQLMDFGLAKEVGSETQLTQVGTTMGTPTYMPPEQAEGDLAGIDAQSDVYSLGAVLYELLTDRAPFEGPTTMSILMKVLEEEPERPRRVNPRIHPDVEAICLKAMAKEKRDRYRSAAELRDDIRRFKAGEMIEAVRGTGWRQLARTLRRHAQLVIVGLALVLGAGAWAVWSAWDAREERIRHRQEQARQAQELLETAGALLEGASPSEEDLKKASELYDRAALLPPGEKAARQGLDRVVVIRRRQRVEFYLDRGRSYLSRENYDAAADMFEFVIREMRVAGPGEFEAARREALQGLRRALGTGTLTVNSRPAGVTVYVAEDKEDRKEFAEPEDARGAALGRKLGITPLTKVDIPMGLHRITLVKEGFGPQSLPVCVERSQDFRLEEEVELFDAKLAGGDVRRVANVVRVPAGTVRLDTGADVEVKEFLIDRYEYPNRLGSPPRRGLSFAEARDLAAKAGKRLPTRAEWMLAAGGDKGLDFPYGEVFKPDYAVTGRTFEAGPQRCGEAHRDRSPAGLYDMSGNVSEWADSAEPAGASPEEPNFHEACGGNWTSVQPSSASTRSALSYESTDQPAQVGFRCVLPVAGVKLPPAPKPKPPADAAGQAEVILKECPAGMVRIAPQPGTPAGELVKYPFCIDRYEFPNEPGKKPRAKVTWEEADKLARARGLRLPTFEEWQVAAGGEKLWAYPSGDNYEPGKLAVELGAEDGPKASGATEGAKSPFEVFDLNGNLFEWVQPRVIDGRRRWGVAGGCWLSSPEKARSSSWEERPPETSADTVGFRCAARLEK
jgi:formylglycine-generating enzyme required for sulfatase activity/predicted Ser/Thr protein kinase